MSYSALASDLGLCRLNKRQLYPSTDLGICDSYLEDRKDTYVINPTWTISKGKHPSAASYTLKFVLFQVTLS